jgi:hypothetical protein
VDVVIANKSHATACRYRGGLGLRQEYGEDASASAASGAAAEAEYAVVLLNNLFDEWETQTTAPITFRCKERIEDPGDLMNGDATTIVGDRHA